jgi:hypothetical protein
MRTFLKSKKGIAALIATLVVAISAVGAFAYFTTTGSGSGTATVGTSTNLALVGTAPTTLYPGTSSNVTFTADNTSPGHQQLGTIYLASVQAYPSALDRTNDTNLIAGCGSISDGAFANPAIPVADYYMADVVSNQDFGPSASPQGVTATGTLVMNNRSVSQDACKSAFLKLNLLTRP